VLKKILGHKWDEVTGDWRGLHTEEHLIATSDIILFCDLMKNSEMGMVYDTCGEEDRRVQGFGGEHLKETAPLEDLGVDGMTKYFLRNRKK
jgi:hypothetical protein